MQTTRIDTLNLGSEAIDILKRAFLYDDATLAEGTAEDIAGLPSGLKIQLRKLFPNLSPVTVAAPAPVVTAKPNSLLENLDDRPQAIELGHRDVAMLEGFEVCRHRPSNGRPPAHHDKCSPICRLFPQCSTCHVCGHCPLRGEPSCEHQEAKDKS